MVKMSFSCCAPIPAALSTSEINIPPCGMQVYLRHLRDTEVQHVCYTFRLGHLRQFKGTSSRSALVQGQQTG